MSGYLIYHPKRIRSVFENLIVFHDKTTGNQDPYIWNNKFLHTYCHISQISPIIGDINFWISGDQFPNFNCLYCDLVFKVSEKLYWEDKNHIDKSDAIVDSQLAFQDHYRWAGTDHPYTRRRRFTLKADPENSFQPQDRSGNLLDIVPMLDSIGISLLTLRSNLVASRGSKPMKLLLPDIDKLLQLLSDEAYRKIHGEDLMRIRKDHPELGSGYSLFKTNGCF